MLLLFETPAGFSLFKVKDEKKLDDVEVRTIDRSIDRVFFSAAGGANELWFLRNRSGSGSRGNGRRVAGRRRRRGGVRTVIPAIAGFGDGGTFRSREEDRFDCGEKRARRGAGGQSAGGVCRSIGFGTRRWRLVWGRCVVRGMFFLTDDEFASLGFSERA